MKKSLIILIVVIAVLAIMVMSGVGTYNNLVTKSEGVDRAFSQIDNQLQRRNDLIPNLVETVKGYAAHEREIFENIAEARSRLIGAGSISQKADANAELTGALSRLLAISESYPDLKANQTFKTLTDELAGTENRIAVARMDYNETAESYNASIRRFPASIIAGMFGFERADYFTASEGAREVPIVNFGS